MDPRLLVIGLDCAAGELIFERNDWHLPTLRSLMARGSYGGLQTVMPAITIPAWACMVTGKDPGELGIYGFRNRTDHTYSGLALTTSLSVSAPAVWDHLSNAGKKVVTVGVPPSFPPKTVNGIQVGCFLTPSAKSEYTYPANAREEIAHLLHGSEYLTDCTNFRTEDKDDLIRQIYDMTERRFTVLEDWIEKKSWDFFMFVEIGTDRLHHGFWKFFDPKHRAYEAGNKYEYVIQKYYEDLDAMLARLLDKIDQERTNIYVVSDHGAKRMDGGVAIAQWLIDEGYLAVKNYPDKVTQLAKLEIDWTKTAVWAEGGYYSRVFLNVAGREPLGTVAPSEVESLMEELSRKIRAIPRPDGSPMSTQVYRPEEIYREVRGVAPDMMVYFDDLLWRAVGTVGYDGIYTYENDTGPDDANHAQKGIFIEALAGIPGRGHIEDWDILDMASRFMGAAGVAVPQHAG
ncbi:MAG TPA: alkaline phosphatase family protein [Candidatus Acidoferrales bacterium]|nr:alkaline phosphatase family protein [Candidatus Acidoferrales bacterium]